MPRYIRLTLLLISSVLVGFSAVAQAPVADFTINYPAKHCAPLTVTFTPTPTNATTYTWNFGNGAPTVTNPGPTSTGATYPNAISYTVTLTVSNSSGSNTKTKTVTVDPSPVVDFTATPTSGCTDLPVQFTDASTPGGSGPNTYAWVIGSVPSNAKNPTYTFTACGTYNITLKVTNQYGCEATTSKPNFITAHCKPTVSFAGNPTTHCLQQGITQYNTNFTSVVSGGTSPYTYLWDFGNSIGAPLNTQANPSGVTYTTSVPASYNVKLKVTDAHGCQTELNKPNYINVEKVTANFTLSPSAACMFTPVNVTNTTSPNFTYTSWDWGDFTGNTLGSPATHYYSTPGQKKIKLTAQNGACQDTISKIVTIYPQPDINFSFTPAKPCPAPQVLNFTGTGASNYAWDFGSAPTGSGANPSHLYSSNGFYTVTLVGTDVHGCKDTLTYQDTVKIYDGELNIVADTPGGCIPQQVCFGSYLWTHTPPPNKYLYPHQIVAYDWDFGDGSPHSTTQSPCHTYTTVGTHIVKLKVTTVNGCIFEDTAQIKSDTLPIAGFYAVPTRICNRNEVSFIDTSKYNPNAWTWKIIPEPPLTIPPIIGHTKNFTYLFTDPGLYSVLFYAARNFCWDTAYVDTMIRVDNPKSYFQYHVSCDTPLKVNFTNMSSGYFGISNLSYKWYFGDPSNTTSTVYSPSFKYPALGTYTAMLVTFNDTIGCSDTFKVNIMLQAPELSFTASDTTICPKDWVNFTGSAANGITGDFYWYVDNAYQNFGSSFSFQFLNPGFHTVELVSNDVNLCPLSLKKVNYIVTSKPTVNFTANPTVGCIPMNVDFTDNSTRFPNTPLADIVTRYWEFSNGTATTTSANISQLYPVKGDYDVKLTVTDINGCIDSLRKPLYIHAHKPAAQFNVDDPNACIEQSLTFSNTSTDAVSAYWDFGDGHVSNDYHAHHAYTQVGSYDVRLIVTDAQGCKDTVLVPGAVTITQPEAIFTMDDSFAICPPHTVVFTDQSTSVGPLTYAWDFGNGTSTQQNPVNVYTVSNYYTVVLVVTDQAGCTDTTEAHVNILGYSGALNYTPLLGCSPLQVDFSAIVTNVPSIIWDFSDGNVLQATNTAPVSHTYNNPGAYVPRIIFSDGGGCTSYSIGKDTIKVDGILPGFIHTPACEGYIVQFTDTSKSMFSPITSWKWTFEDNNSSSVIPKPYHYYPSVGQYPVNLVLVNGNGCSDSVRETITVNPLPTITTVPDTIICLNDAAQLQGFGGVSYTWAPAATLSCSNCPDPKAYPPIKTRYSVIGTDANGCSDTAKVLVDIQLKTTSVVGEGGEICDDEFIQLYARGAQNYVWSPAEDVDNSTVFNPVASPHKTTNFMVVATEGSCIPDTNYVKVVVHPKPTVKASGGTTIIAGKSTPIDASGDLIKRFAWTPSQTLSCSDCPSPYATPTRTTTYTVTAYTDFECADSAKVTVEVLCDESQLFIPNTFTPNGDGMNDVFYPRGTGLDKIVTFRVYNRWGEIVYDRGNMKLNDKQAGWDGTYNGKQLPPDVFVYIVEAQCDDGETLKLKGDITLIR